MEALLGAWFREHGRDLPWRRTGDPYAILVSEVMAQQTGVENVKVPTVASPAVVDQLPTRTHAPYVASFAASLRRVFLAAAGIAFLAFLLTWLLRKIPLRHTAATETVAEGIPPLRDDDSQRELELIVACLMERENRSAASTSS